MRLLHKDAITLRRLTGGYYGADGKWVEGGTTDSTLRCVIQPEHLGNRRFIESEGVRSEDLLTIHSRTLLRTADDKTEVEADRLVHLGIVYEVKSVRPWMGIKKLSHYEIIGVRQDKDFNNGSS